MIATGRLGPPSLPVLPGHQEPRAQAGGTGLPPAGRGRTTTGAGRTGPEASAHSPTISTCPRLLLDATASAPTGQGGGRWMGPLPPGPRTKELHGGRGVQPATARLVSQEAPNQPPQGSLGAQRGSPPGWEAGQEWQQNEYMRSWGRLGTSMATSRGWVTGTPATEQAWLCWGR